MNKLFKYLFYDQQSLWAAFWSYVGHVFSDETYLRVRFRLLMGKWPNLKDPKTFSEKIQWLKLHDRNPEYTKMVDKFTVKEYVAGIIGSKYVIPTLGVWDSPNDIEWDTLPDKFVLKTTHGGGSNGVVLCTDKSKFDIKKAKAKLKKNLRTYGYRIDLEWPYKNVKHRIIAEKYIEPSLGNNDLPDYKFFCFNGEPRYCQVISGRGTKMCIDFFDYDWNHQLFHEPHNYPFSDVMPTKPVHFDHMWDMARQLAQNKAFSRIDFYETGTNVYFGEITFYPTSGVGGFSPEEFDLVFGQMINLNVVNLNE